MAILIHATPVQARTILGAMRQAGTAGGRFVVSDAVRKALASADRYVFDAKDRLNVDALPAVRPAELAAMLTGPPQAEMATRFLAVMALMDGVLDRARVDTVLEYAGLLGVREGYLAELSESVCGNLQWALNDMTRQNILSLWNEPWDESVDIMDVLLPYKGQSADPALAARYKTLERLPQGTVGRAFWEIYTKNGYAFPGEANAVNARFATPHDSTHVVSGYDTSPQGEILVSTFTAGMHPMRPMEGHILPVIYSWHLEIKINDLAKSAKGQLDPEQFWVAWTRGARTAVDLFALDWDFWAHVEEPVEEVRRRYRVSPHESRHPA